MEYLRFSSNNLKAMIQLPALLKSGKKARHWKKTDKINLVLLLSITNLNLFGLSEL